MIKLTVFFDDPFWVGIIELSENNELRTVKIVFGSEPKDYEVYSFINNNFFKLKFSSPVEDPTNFKKPKNPKRIRREISKALHQKTISTKAQQALALEREKCKEERKKKTKEMKELEKEFQYQKRQERKKEKKRGH